MNASNRLQWIAKSPSTMTAPPKVSFGKGIEPRNLRLCDHGAAHVSLAGDWAALAQGLHGLGQVVASTLNDAAILTQRGRFPEFEFCPGGRFAVNGLGGLGFDFAEWRRVWATRRPTAKGVCQSLAIVGHDNSAAHQVLLLDDSIDETFPDFARRHQGEPPRVRACWPARGEGICCGYHERFRCRKWERVESSESGSRRLAGACLPRLFEAVLAARLRLTTTIVSAPVIQSALWTPVAIERTERRVTVTAEETQLRLQLGAVAEVWSVPPPDGVDAALALELYDAQDRLLLGFSVTLEHVDAWSALIASLPSA
jgi:putative heme degradation protein